MSYATVIMYNIESSEDEEGRMDFVGRDCEDVEEALGYLREGLAKMRAAGKDFIFAGMQANVTVEQLMEKNGAHESTDQG